MRKIMGVVMVMGMVAGPASALADRGASDSLAACADSIERVLGQTVRTRLYGIAHRRQGDRLRLRVLPAQGEGQTLNCWVDSEGRVSLQTADGMALSTAPGSDSQQLTLSK